MNYSAKKIFLTCDEKPVREWSNYMLTHLDEVGVCLAEEKVRRETWYLGRENDSLYVIGVMDVDDQPTSAAIAQTSTLGVDKVHRAFKSHWDRNRMETLNIDPTQPPAFDECELLFDARPSCIKGQ